MERAKGFEPSTPTMARVLRATRCVVRRNREGLLGAMTTWLDRVFQVASPVRARNQNVPRIVITADTG
jgi:hypothetical protein